jgi:hypothetical protein
LVNLIKIARSERFKEEGLEKKSGKIFLKNCKGFWKKGRIKRFFFAV